MPQHVRHAAILTAVAALVFLTRLGATHLWDDDETYFAQVAQEMSDRGDLIVPWFNDRLFAHKPPFMYWMMMGAYRLLGVSEFAARLPSALFGMGCVLLVWRMGCRLYCATTGLWAGIILATCVNFAVIARAATADAELTFFCMLPLALFVRCTHRLRAAGAEGSAGNQGKAHAVWRFGPDRSWPAWWDWAGIYAAMGVAVLVKGPIGAALPFGVLALFLLWVNAPPRATLPPRIPGMADGRGGRATVLARVVSGWLGPAAETVRWCARALGPRRTAETIWRMRPLTAACVVGLVAGPWFAAVGWRTQGAFLEGFFGVHHLHRFLNPMENHGGPVVYYLGVMCVGLFPWILFAMPAGLQTWRRLRERQADGAGDMLACCWCAVWVGFFSLASTKFPHYVVPAYPALALLTARFVAGWIDQPTLYPTRSRRGAWITLGVVAAGFAAAAVYLAPAYVGGRRLWAPAVPLALGAAACAWLTERLRIQAGVAALAASGGAFLLALLGLAAVEIDAGQTSHTFARALASQEQSAKARLAAWRYFRPGLVFYVNDRVEPLQTAEQAVAWLTDQPRGACLLTTQAEYAALAGQLPEDVAVVARRPWFLKSERALVLLTRAPDSRAARQAAATTREAPR